MQEQLDARAPEVQTRPGDLAAAFELFRILGAALPTTPPAALEAACPSPLHLLLASLSHLYPSQRADSDLKALFDHCRHRKPAFAAPPAHALFGDILAAAAANSALMLLAALGNSGLCGDWLAAHAALLLEKHPRFAEELAAPISSSQVCPVRESVCV